MNKPNLQELLRETMKQFDDLTLEQHRAIMNNPDYDGLYHIFDEMSRTELLDEDFINCPATHFTSIFIPYRIKNGILNDMIELPSVNSHFYQIDFPSNYPDYKDFDYSWAA